MIPENISSLIKANIEKIDESKEIPKDLISELLNENFFRLLLPRSYGGLEMDFIDYLEIIFELASYDASVAWCINQSNVLATNAAFMVSKLAKKIFDNPKSIISNGPPIKSNVKETKEGVIVSGKWSFSSGIKNANWVLGVYTDKNKENKNIMFPITDVNIADDWNVNGLRGTGSYSFSVKNKLVPKENIFYDRKHLHEKGPIYKIPRELKFSAGFSTIAHSLANSTINFTIEFSKNKNSISSTQLSKEQVFIREIGIMKAIYGSSKSFLNSSVRKVWSKVSDGDNLDDESIAELRLASTHAIRSSENIVKKAYSLLGSSSIFKFNDIQRCFQDMLAISQQIQGRMSHYETVGSFYINSKLKKIL